VVVVLALPVAPAPKPAATQLSLLVVAVVNVDPLGWLTPVESVQLVGTALHV
jgi:hypothetical protein